jgi:hypothetical protein
MGFEITDGTGKGNSAGVDVTGRLLTRSITESIFQNAAEEGEAFFIGTPLITATTANESALIYIKNNENSPLILGSFFLTAENSNATVQMFRVNWYKNPTSITGGTATVALNQNFGSSETLDVDIEYGAEASGIVGGTLSATLSFPIGQFNQFDANLVLEKGSSVVISVVPPSGNTGMPVQFGTRSIKYIERY